MLEINTEIVDQIISIALNEDCGVGDLTTSSIIASDLTAGGEFLAKEDLILAGWQVVVRAFQKVSASISAETGFQDGDFVTKCSVLGCVHGHAAKLLTSDSVVL